MKSKFILLTSCFVALGLGIAGYLFFEKTEHANREVASNKKVGPCILNLEKFIEFRNRKFKKINYYIELKEAYHADDFDAFKRMVWSTHDNFDKKENTLPIGFSRFRDQYELSTLMRANDNDYVPSLYLFGKKDEDTFGVIDLVTKPDKVTADKGMEALSDANRWIDTYMSYQTRLDSKIEEGFQAKMQLEVLKKVRGDFKYDDFIGEKRVTISLPYIENGRVVQKDKKFGDMVKLRIYISDLEKSIKHIFTHNIDEIAKDSEIYEVIFEQAYMRRRIEFLYDAMEDIRQTVAFTPEQNALARRLKLAINRKNLNPRSDAIKKVQVEEINYEFRTMFKSEKTKRKNRDLFKFEWAQDIMEKTMSNSKLASLPRNALIFFLTSTGIGTIGSLIMPVTENDYYNLFTANIYNRINTFLTKHGINKGLINCAKENRATIVEIKCYHEYIFSHLSRYFYRSRIDAKYNYLEDPEFLEKRAELTRKFQEMRDEKGNAEFFTDNVDYLKETAYASYSSEVFLRLFSEENKLSDETKELIAKAIDLKITPSENENFDDVKSQIATQLTEDQMEVLNTYFDNFDKITAYYREVGSTPKVEDIGEFITETAELK